MDGEGSMAKRAKSKESVFLFRGLMSIQLFFFYITFFFYLFTYLD